MESIANAKKKDDKPDWTSKRDKGPAPPKVNHQKNKKFPSWAFEFQAEEEKAAPAAAAEPAEEPAKEPTPPPPAAEEPPAAEGKWSWLLLWWEGHKSEKYNQFFIICINKKEQEQLRFFPSEQLIHIILITKK